MQTYELRGEYALNDFFSTNAINARMVATKGKLRLQEYRPDPSTGKQKPGTLLRFGLPDLDAMMSMLKGCYYLIAARPRTGKTALGMQVAETVMRQLRDTNKLVVVFSAEMDSASLSLREACALEKVSYWKMVQGQLEPEQYDRLNLRLEQMGTQGFWLDETSAPTLEHMGAQLETLREAGKEIGFVLFDYLELAGETAKSEPDRMAKIGRGFKSLAKKYDCPVLALGQLNRSIETEKDQQPGLSMLMYGGEREPDGIVILDRPWLRDNTRPKELVDAWVVKHRHGPGGNCVLRFDDGTMRFQSAVVVRTELNSE